MQTWLDAKGVCLYIENTIPMPFHMTGIARTELFHSTDCMLTFLLPRANYAPTSSLALPTSQPAQSLTENLDLWQDRRFLIKD
jgi:hypothetical protein